MNATLAPTDTLRDARIHAEIAREFDDATAMPESNLPIAFSDRDLEGCSSDFMASLWATYEAEHHGHDTPPPETVKRRCKGCRCVMVLDLHRKPGRVRRYCSSACRQKAYRLRRPTSVTNCAG